MVPFERSYREVSLPLPASVALASTLESVDEENDCCVSGSTKSGPLKGRIVHPTLKIWGPLILSLLLLALLPPLCHDRKSSAVTKGVESRRLAEGDDTSEEDWVEYAYLESLCVSLGPWAPSTGLPDGARTSPAMVDEVLATLEEGGAESSSSDIPGISDEALVYQAVSGFVSSLPADPFEESSPISGDGGVDVARSTSQVGDEESEHYMPPQASGEVLAVHHERSGRKHYRPEDAERPEPSLSWKIAKLDWPAIESSGQPVVAAQQLRREIHPRAQHSDASRVDNIHTDPLREGASYEEPGSSSSLEPPSSFGPAPSLQPQPSAATSRAPETSPSDSGKTHPYVRIPSILPGVVPRPLNVDRIFDKRGPQSHVFLLREVREVLVTRPVLRLVDAHYLLDLAEQLANHMYNKMSTDITGEAPYKTTNLLGRRFLIFDVMYSVSVALNLNWPLQPWWRSLAERVPTEVDVSGYFKTAHPLYVSLIEDMVEALRLFKSGVRPKEEMIISIKRRLFCSKYATYYMKASCWNDWREDDKNS
ncbi:hypothetical protein ACSSS7_000725 [Eimeria intestinalis]